MPCQAEPLREAKDKRTKANTLHTSPNQPAASLGFDLLDYRLIFHVYAWRSKGRAENER
jgi:hypothetical protein